jgi:hypothetical protein
LRYIVRHVDGVGAEGVDELLAGEIEAVFDVAGASGIDSENGRGLALVENWLDGWRIPRGGRGGDGSQIDVLDQPDDENDGGELDQDSESKAGGAGTHGYSVLDVRGG